MEYDKVNCKQWAYHKRERRKINNHMKRTNKLKLQLSTNCISYKGHPNESNTIKFFHRSATKNNIKEIIKPLLHVSNNNINYQSLSFSHHKKWKKIDKYHKYRILKTPHNHLYLDVCNKKYSSHHINNRAKRKIDNMIQLKQYMNSKPMQETQQNMREQYINQINYTSEQTTAYSEYKKQTKTKRSNSKKSKIQKILKNIFSTNNWIRAHLYRKDITRNLSPYKCELLVFGYTEYKDNILCIPDVISDLIMRFYYLGDICNMCYNYAPNGLMQYNRDKNIFTQENSLSIDNILISNKGLEMDRKYVFRVNVLKNGARDNGIGIIECPELIIDYMNSEKAINKAWWFERQFYYTYHEFRKYKEGDLIEIYIHLSSTSPSTFIIEKNGKYFKKMEFGVFKGIYYPYIAWTNRRRSEKPNAAEQKVSFELLY
eukprot:462787_1